MTNDERERLWQAINDYMLACGGRPDTIDIPRQKAVVVLERVVEEIARASFHRATGEALNSGDGRYRP